MKNQLLIFAVLCGLKMVANAQLSASAEKAHRLDISTISGKTSLKVEITGTYEIKDGSIEIQIKRGEIGLVSQGTWRLVNILFTVFEMSGPSTVKNVVSADKIEINKTVEYGDKYRLHPQTVILKHASISGANAEKQWIAATIYVDNNGSTTGQTLHAPYYCGTKEKVDMFKPKGNVPAPPVNPAPAKPLMPIPASKQPGMLRFELKGYEISQDDAATLFIAQPAEIDPKAMLAATASLLAASKATLVNLPFIEAFSGARAKAVPVSGYTLEGELTLGADKKTVEAVCALRRLTDQSGMVLSVLSQVQGVTFLGTLPGSSADTVVLAFSRITQL